MDEKIIKINENNYLVATGDVKQIKGNITKDLTITDDEAHYMIGYVKELNELTGNKSTVPDAGGTYLLDGVQATAYARIRYTAGNDYKRAERH